LKFKLYEGRKIIPHTKKEMGILPVNQSEESPVVVGSKPRPKSAVGRYPLVCILSIANIARVRFIFDETAVEYIFLEANREKDVQLVDNFDLYYSRWPLIIDKFNYMLYFSNYTEDMVLPPSSADYFNFDKPYSYSAGFIDVNNSTLQMISQEARMETDWRQETISSLKNKTAAPIDKANIYCLIDTIRQLIPSLLANLYDSFGIDIEEDE